MNVMDGKHNQQFWLRSTISQQYSIPTGSELSVQFWNQNLLLGRCHLQCASQLCCLSHEGVGELLQCMAGPFVLWKEGLVCIHTFSGCGGGKPKAMTVEWTFNSGETKQKEFKALTAHQIQSAFVFIHLSFKKLQLTEDKWLIWVALIFVE